MIATLIKRIAQHLDGNRIPYMMIGGQAIERANKVMMEGYPVSFSSREDVITHKMFAARAIDLEDVRHILAKSRQHIDLGYIRHWLSEFSTLPEHERIGEDFEKLIPLEG